MANKKSRIKKHLLRHKKHISILLIIFLIVFGIVELGIYLYKNQQDFIYPPLPRNQLSPKQILNQQTIKLDQSKIPPIIEHGSKYQYKVALTFNADMTPAMQRLLQLGIVKSWINPGIKKILDSQNTKATIFFSKLWVETYPKEAKELAQDPLIEIGNHSFAHPAFNKKCYHLPLIDSQPPNQILLTQETIKETTGITPKYFRFSSDCVNQTDLQNINDLGLKVIYRDITALDGFNQNPESIVQAVESQVQNGSIIVFHLEGGPLAPKTTPALVRIIPYLKDRGYQLVTISELLNEGSN